MSNREPVGFQNPLRRLPCRRRRVGAQAVADIFIRSLVVASFCPDHGHHAHIPSGTGTRLNRPSRVEFGSSVTRSTQRGQSIEGRFTQPPILLSFHSSKHSRFMSTAQVCMKTNEEPEEPSTTAPPPLHADESPESNTTMEGENMAGAHRPETDPNTGMDHDNSLESQKNEDRPKGRVSILEYIKKTRAVDLVTAEMFQQDSGAQDDPDDPRRHSVDLIAFLTALHDKSKSNQYVFTCYKKLPYPGVSYLSRMERKILLRRFAKPLDRRRSHARYYLQLVQDMIEAKLPMNRWHWTNAIYFTAHKVPVLERRDLYDALSLWRRMEAAGIASDGAIFELLYNIANKSYQFSVADSLIHLMEKRGLRLSRHGLVSKIYASGLRQDVNGVQNGFDEFIRSGGIVDTTVLNALLSSLLQAGASDVAQELYSKMMKTYAAVRSEQERPKRKLPDDFSPPTFTEFGSWRRNSSRLGDIFKRYTRRMHEYTENPAQVQDLVPMTPDTRTFYIVFRHHCLHTGNLREICQILRDMETVFTVPPQSFIYNFLFLAFSRYKAADGWTRERLQDVWVVFRRLLFESETRLAKLESDGLLIESRWENPLKSTCIYLLGPSDTDQFPPPPRTGVDRMEEEKMMKKFDDMGHYRRSSYLDDSTPRRLENTMLLSRGLNIAILKAFGAHVGPRELVSIYTQIERIWKPWKRLPSDAHAVKNELDRQLMRIRDRERAAVVRPTGSRSSQ